MNQQNSDEKPRSLARSRPDFELGEWIGRVQAFRVIANQCPAAEAKCLKTIHDFRYYETYGLTWEQSCTQRLGIHRTTAERIIRGLEEFGDTCFGLSTLIHISTGRRAAHPERHPQAPQQPPT